MISKTLVSTIFLFFTLSAFAGAPLKGVDVKLGKAPGGTPVSRTTNNDGKAVFTDLKKGSYYVTVTFPTTPQSTERFGNPLLHYAHIFIDGTVRGRIERELDSAAINGRFEPMIFEIDGRRPVTVLVEGE